MTTDNPFIHLEDSSSLKDLSHFDPQGIAVIMPCTDIEAGQKTAAILHSRAGVACHIFIVHDRNRQGFIKTFNEIYPCLTVKYIVYLAQDAWPCRGWLHCAHQALEKSGKGFLGFNDGKWHGRIASFGMARTAWIRTLYGPFFFFPAYRSHAADLELTVLAQALDQYLYLPDCTLVEVDPDKDLGGSNLEDHSLYEKRLANGFEGLAPLEKFGTINQEYSITMTAPADLRAVKSNKNQGVSVIILTRNGAHSLKTLLRSFFRNNTHAPVELIVIDHGATDNTFDSIANYADQAMIRIIPKLDRDSDAVSCNLAAQKATYPYLLFIDSDIVHTSDMLPRALQLLEDETIGVVLKAAIQVKDGIPSAVIRAFMLCRKVDFQKIGGFFGGGDDKVDDIDFCLRVGRDLKKAVFVLPH